MSLRRQGGFTLAEMLIALAVSALLVSLAYASLRIGMRSWDASSERVEQSDSMRIGWQFLHHALSGARQLGDPLSQNGEALFSGEANRLRFGADMPSHLGLGGLYVIDLRAREHQGKQSLVLERTLLSEYRQPNTANHPQRAALVDELGSLEIRYFGSEDEDLPPSWHREWHAQDALPALIRIKVRDAAGNNWPVLIAHPRLGQRASISEQELLDLELDSAEETSE